MLYIMGEKVNAVPATSRQNNLGESIRQLTIPDTNAMPANNPTNAMVNSPFN